MKYRAIALLSIFIFLTASKCDDDEPKDDNEIVIKDRTEQYTVEKDSIEHYLQTHYYEIDAQYNVTLDTINPAGSHTSIWDDPNLKIVQVADPKVDDLIYDLYYIPFRTGENKEIKKFDDVLVSYKTQLLNNKIVQEKIDNIPEWLRLINNTVKAWKEILPKFKDGTFTDNGDGTFTFSGYGAGLFITPSGLGYYQNSIKKIPSYSPLIISFKTFVVNDDLDDDNVKNIDEDVNNNGIISDDDTDNDDFINIFDKDDDGDGILTKDEDANGDGNPTNDDSDNDGIPDYLDSDTH